MLDRRRGSGPHRLPIGALEATDGRDEVVDIARLEQKAVRAVLD